MVQTKEQKKKIVEDLKEKIEKQKIIIFVNFTGLRVKDLSELRARLKLIDAVFKVSKKTLLCLALKEYDKELAEKISQMKGQLATVFGFDKEPLVAKTLYQFSLENSNLKILGGYFEGEFRESKEIIFLAKLPTREELLAQLIRGISAPIVGLVNVLEGNLRNLIYILSQIKPKEQTGTSS
jgi:large subunit ribosomal protein L10